MSLLLLLFLGLGPSLLWMYWIWTRDTHHKESPGLLVAVLLGGGLLSVVLTLGTVRLYDYRLPTVQASPALTLFLIAALPEECFKLLAVLLLVWWSKRWDEPFDGIVYAGAVGLGFHLIETLTYMWERWSSLESILYQGLVRGAKPGHMLYGIAMGYFLSKARFAPRQERPRHFALALVVPVALHLAWDVASAYGGGFVYGESLADLLFALVAWALSVALWLIAFQHIRVDRAASPWNPERRLSLPAAASPCPVCAGAYPRGAAYCQRCGTPLAHPAPQR